MMAESATLGKLLELGKLVNVENKAKTKEIKELKKKLDLMKKANKGEALLEAPVGNLKCQGPQKKWKISGQPAETGNF